jgi:hypothetical protein
VNQTRKDEENMEDLLKGVYERMKEHKLKEKATKSKAYKQNPNPFISGDGLVLVAVENSEGIWEVPES